MMRGLWLSMCLLTTQIAAAADLGAEIRTRLLDAPLLRGQFEQQKQVSGFRQPLLSSGDFLLWRQHGLIWQTRKPFSSSLVLNQHGLRAQQGSAAYQLDSQKEPSLALVNELLLALLAGDTGLLAKRFRLEGELQGKDGWQLRLTPTDAGLARVFRRVELRGDRYVREARLEETNGDSSLIRFSQLSQAPAATADEARRLAE